MHARNTRGHEWPAYNGRGMHARNTRGHEWPAYNGRGMHARNTRGHEWPAYNGRGMHALATGRRVNPRLEGVPPRRPAKLDRDAEGRPPVLPSPQCGRTGLSRFGGGDGDAVAEGGELALQGI